LGVWSASTVYYKDDVVQSGSSTYICTVDTTSGGDAPSVGNTNFLMLAAGAEGFLALAGGVMTGDLTLSGNPTNNLHAAPKQYVDSAIDSVVVDQIPLITMISTDKTLLPGRVSFGAGALTISGNAIYTISAGSIHQML